MKTKIEATTAWIEKAEGRIGELEDKIMENRKLRKREIKNPGV